MLALFVTEKHGNDLNAHFMHYKKKGWGRPVGTAME